MSIFYDPTKMLSYNALLNFLIGQRGVGKTYSIKKFCVQDFIKHGHQFVYLRRYKSELSKLSTFFDPLNKNHEFDDHGLKVNGSTFEIDLQEAGFAFPLSTAKILKSQEFASVKNIIFDEFLVDKGTYRYLPNEVNDFLDIIETIARLRDVRVFLLANAISTVNPYFNFFDISLPYGCEFKTFKDGLILIEYIKNDAYIAEKSKSRFGRLIEGTAYGDYAVKNKFLRDSSTFLRKKSGNCRNWSIIIYEGQKYGIWINPTTRETFVSKDFDPNNPCVFAPDMKSHDEKTILISARSSVWFKPILAAYRAGTLYFESQKIKQGMMKLLEKCLTM